MDVKAKWTRGERTIAWEELWRRIFLEIVPQQPTIGESRKPPNGDDADNDPTR